MVNSHQRRARRLWLRRMIGDSTVRRLKRVRLRLFQLGRLPSGTWTGLNGLDLRLVEAMESRAGPGVYIEFGANDGIQQSNTYGLERELGWTGVLIEPIPALAAECARNRPNSIVICAAVADQGGTPLALEYSDLRSRVSKGGRSFVGTVALNDVCSSLLQSRPDLISVDVEGFELDALRGFDWERFGPLYLLVETKSPQLVSAAVGGRYSAPVALSHHDYLFTRVGKDLDGVPFPA